MKKTGTEGIQKGIISGTLVVVLVLTAFVGADFSTRKDAKAGTGTNTGTAQATVTEELTAKRSKFVKQFALSDGSFTATIYSMPIHYKKNGRWKEINTTLVKSGKTKYKTKATDLSIKVSKKANKKSVVSLKRGKNQLIHRLKRQKTQTIKSKDQQSKEDDIHRCSEPEQSNI